MAARDREPCPGCSGERDARHALCGACWRTVPKHLRESFYATRPHSNARRAALLEVYRFIIG